MKKITLFLAMILIMLVALILLSTNVKAVNVVETGTFGVNNSCKWTFYDDGNFVIEPVGGTGTLDDDSSLYWAAFKDGIKTFTIKPGVKAPNSMDKFFTNLNKVEVLNVNELDVSDVTSMLVTFQSVGNNAANPINELDLSKWNTSKVSVMESMFSDSNIKSLKLGKGFDTSNVEYFGSMFAGSRFEELILNFDTSKLNSFTVMSMFQDATHLKKLDISSFDMTKARSTDQMFMNVGKDAKEGTEIILNSTFGGLAPSEFADYEFPYDFYTINGGDVFNLNSLNNRIAQTTGKASLIPVFPFDVHDGSGVSYNKYNHRTGTKIDTSKIKNITPKDGFRLIKWTDTQDPKNATIEIPAGGQSTSTYADFYNTKNVLNPGITLYAQWEEIKYIAKFDLNGGTGKNGFTPFDQEVGYDFESLIPTWDELKDFIEAPFGKVYIGVEINGEKVNPGVNYKPTEDVTIKLLWEDKYKILDGANQTYTIFSGKDIVIKASGDKANLTSITMDGTAIDVEKYNTVNGSTILTLKSSYLDTVAPGSHKIGFVYNDGSVETGLTIAVANSGEANDNGDNNLPGSTNTENNTNNATTSKTPKTGDNITLWIALLVVATLGTVGTVKYLRKRN